MSNSKVFAMPGGTSLDAVEGAYQMLHTLFNQEPHTIGQPELSHDVVMMTAPWELPTQPSTSHATSPCHEVHDFDDQLAQDALFFSGIDIIIPTSGSATGTPHMVGISKEALMMSSHASHTFLGGPGHWIVALPIHHIAGLQVLIRAVQAEIKPEVIDTTDGFTPRQLLPAIAGATQNPDIPGYLSLVPTQLHDCLRAGDDDVIDALKTLKAILVGGSHISNALLDASRAHGLPVVTTYGATETAGGCVYNGIPLPGISVRTIDIDGASHLAISGSTLMTRYLEGDCPIIEENGVKWLLTGDLGMISASGKVTVLGRADDVIISGGQSIAPHQVRNAVVSHPDIDDAWVFGIDDERWGSIVAVATVPTDTIRTSLEQFGHAIREHVAQSIGRLYAPRVVMAFDKLPVLPGGKIDQHQLRKLAQGRIAHGDLWQK